MFFRRKPTTVRSAVLGPDGFCIRDDARVVCRVEWSSVREIAAFKRDLFSYDELCIGFRTDDTDRYAEVWESDPGYAELLAELPRHFAEIRTDWFEQVAHPAFATNWTTIWGEALQSQKGLTRRCS